MIKCRLRASLHHQLTELALPVEGGGVIPKLKTEKPEPFGVSIQGISYTPSHPSVPLWQRISGTKKKPYASFSKADSFPSMKDIALEVGNSSPVPSLDFENCNDEECTFKFGTSLSVMIKNEPSIINLLQLKEAISAFVKVPKASKRSVPNGLDCCDIEFKSVESRNTAPLIGSITVKNFSLPISLLHSFETVTITIGNISSETADSAIHSTCTLCGRLEGLVRTKEDVLDAIFSVKGETDTKSILKK
ncbi:PREDICTED: uncharacterized protein LOC18613667 [Theobroma cacao]|uniref:Uncharacterized protein LOC18613667 n=1 Tax=Theobroma cacao TaxID=3641 RepID=A0AB32W4X0_THECC|nr:PREDICTED: uncharacterized protein LOC18613667 [Theobroma cacao]